MDRPKMRDLFWFLMVQEYSPVMDDVLKSHSWSNSSLCPVLEVKLHEVCLEYIKTLKVWTAISSSPSVRFIQIGTKTIRNGSYLTALVDGLKEVQEIFLKECESMKFNYVRNPTIAHHSDLQLLFRMKLFYSHMNSMFQEIIDRDLSGPQILDISLKYVELSLGFSDYMKRSVKLLQKILLKDINLWILHGELDTHQHEFFVKKHFKSPVEDLSYNLTDSNTSCSMMSSFLSEFDASMSASTCTKLPFDIERVDDDAVYEIDANNVPSLFSCSLVSKILNVGKILILLKHEPSDDITDPFGFVCIDNYGLNENEIRKKLLSILEQPDLFTYLLEEIVDEVWLGLNKYLKAIACDVGGLRKEFENINDLFLMGRGDLFKSFIKNVGTLLYCEATTVRSQSLISALELAADDLYGSTDILERFTVMLPPKHVRPKGSKTIHVIKINYKTLWPLHLIFTNEVMESYNMIFRFLLTLKTVHTEILHVYPDLKHSNNTNNCQEPVLRLHHLLDNVLVNLQGYIFIDVIMSEKSKFEEVLNNSESFHEIQKAHGIFLSNVLSQMFLIHSKLPDDRGEMSSICRNESLVQEELKKLFTLSIRFCKLLSLIDFDESVRFETFLKMLETAERLIMGILALVDTIHEKYSAEHLSRLVARLDYNRFFSKNISSETSNSLTSY